ncbi:hypothetical protein L484_020454 [Morus notabilis]|uniref:Uncharacterized protein n=1 Tax=Morus notabilis TaxID=981085 RepID=W9SLV6_9ROSA|nr:hypothetical protein L484_020454 [Morus notabilis]
MAAVVAMSNCSFSVLTSTVKLRCSVSARRRFTTLRGSVRSVAPKAADQRKRVSHSRKGSLSSSSSDKSNRERDFVSEKEFRSKSKDESAYLYANGCKGGGDIRKPQTTAYKPFGMQRKEKREFMSDSKEQQVEPGNFQDAAFLNAVVKVKVKRRGDDTKYVAKVLARGVDCDIALLSVESKGFWEGVEPLNLGRLPHLQVFLVFRISWF